MRTTQRKLWLPRSPIRADGARHPPHSAWTMASLGPVSHVRPKNKSGVSGGANSLCGTGIDFFCHLPTPYSKSSYPHSVWFTPSIGPLTPRYSRWTQEGRIFRVLGLEIFSYGTVAVAEPEAFLRSSHPDWCNCVRRHGKHATMTITSKFAVGVPGRFVCLLWSARHRSRSTLSGVWMPAVKQECTKDATCM